MRKLHKKCEYEQHSNKDTIVSRHLSLLCPQTTTTFWAQFVCPPHKKNPKNMMIIKERFARNVCDLFSAVWLFAGSAATQHLPRRKRETSLITVRDETRISSRNCSRYLAVVVVVAAAVNVVNNGQELHLRHERI